MRNATEIFIANMIPQKITGIFKNRGRIEVPKTIAKGLIVLEKTWNTP